jgi:CheY-like chemotaxis protein
MKLLVIEDSSDVRLFIQLELIAHGYSVLLAESAEAGLDLARRARPALIISDLGLPGIDGLDLMRRVRADECLRDIPAIALSGFGDSSRIKGALAAGYQAALVKPFETADLLSLIARLVPRPGSAAEMAP